MSSLTSAENKKNLNILQKNVDIEIRFEKQNIRFRVCSLDSSKE